jgi:hypothetical protein
LRHGRNTMRTSSPAALSGRSRGIAFRRSDGMTGRSVPRSAWLARSRIAEIGAPGGPECGMAADSAFRSSHPRLPWSRPGPAACHARRAAGKLAALRSGASSDRPVQGSSRALAKGPRKVADCDRREHGGAATAAGRGRCGARRSRPVSAGAAAARARLPRAQAARSVFLRVPRGAILLPVMAGGAWRGISMSMLVHFATAKRKVASRLSRVTLRPGTGRSKMCLKQLYVLTVRGLYIN